MTPTFRSGQRGISLLEVLVTLIVLVIGLLGMAALQLRAQQAETEAYQRAQAIILLEDISARIRMNRANRDCYAYDGYLGVGATFGGFGCEGVDDDLEEWDAALKGAAEQLDGDAVGAMIGARGCISGGGESYRVTIVWQGLSSTAAPVADGCGEGLYGDEAMRRLVSRDIRFANLD